MRILAADTTMIHIPSTNRPLQVSTTMYILEFD